MRTQTLAEAMVHQFANNIRGMAPSRGNAEPWVSLKIWVHRDLLVCHRQLDLIVLSMSLGQNSLIDNRFCYQKYAVYDFWFNCCFWMIYSLLSNQHGLETILKSSPQDESPRCFGFTRQSGDIPIDYKRRSSSWLQTNFANYIQLLVAWVPLCLSGIPIASGSGKTPIDLPVIDQIATTQIPRQIINSPFLQITNHDSDCSWLNMIKRCSIHVVVVKWRAFPR